MILTQDVMSSSIIDDDGRWKREKRATVLYPHVRNELASTESIVAMREPLTTSPRRGVRVFRPVVRPPQIRRTRRFIPTARWEGAVIERMGTYFIAEVIDLDNEERAMVEFDFAELTPSDVDLCEPGALFYWSVGYDIRESGQRSRSSVILFRRLGRPVD